MKDTIKKVAAHTSQAVLALLLDFLNAIGKEERKEFFYDNKKTIDTLVGYYWDEFKKEIHEKRSMQLAKYRSRICFETKAKWGIWKKCALSTSFNDKGNRIGIDCFFTDETRDKELGMFHIYITTWKKSHIAPYRKDLKEVYPNIKERIDGDRVYLQVAELAPDNQDAIIFVLKHTYNTLKSIAEKHK